VLTHNLKYVNLIFGDIDTLILANFGGFLETLYNQFLIDLANFGGAEWISPCLVFVVDAVFSGDNSILINVLASNVKDRKTRLRVIWFGMALAAVLRFVAICFVSFIMTNSWVQVLGALYICRISYLHFTTNPEQNLVQGVSNIFLLSLSIGFLDLAVSFDNIIGVFAMS